MNKWNKTWKNCLKILFCGVDYGQIYHIWLWFIQLDAFVKDMSYCLWKSCKIWTFSDHSCKMAYFKENILQGVKILNNWNIKQIFRITVKYLFLIWFGQTKACFIKEHIIFLKIFAFLSKPPFSWVHYVESLNKFILFTFFCWKMLFLGLILPWYAKFDNKFRN